MDDFTRKSSIQQPKEWQIESCWIPTTPVKPGLTEPQPICTENQPFQVSWLQSERFQQGQSNWPEPQGFSYEFSQHTHSHGVACCGSSNFIDADRGFDNWEADLTAKSRAYDKDMNLYSKFGVDCLDKLNNVPFGDLLALADAATVAASPANASVQAIFNATSTSTSTSSSGCCFGIQMENNQFQTSSISTSFGNQDGSNFQINNYTTDFPQYGCSTPVLPSFDLNSPPRATTEAVLSNVTSQFAPITPDQAKKKEKRQVLAIPNLSVPGSTNLEDEVNQLYHDKEQPQVLQNQSCAAVYLQLQEDHNPDKGGNQGNELNEAPQQKPRRKRHRPKVVIEGKPKRIRKPATPKPAGPKRKYIRRNGIEKRTTTPSAEVTSRTIEPKTVGRTRKSRKCLNFDLESQVREESSSCKATSNFDSESHAQNSNKRVQSRSSVQSAQEMEVIVEKMHVGITYDLAYSSMDQPLEDYLSMPDRPAPTPTTLTKANPPHEKLMSDAQNECKRGKCRIVFSDETHDKGGSAVQMIMNINAQSTPRSPDDSNCSSSTRFTKGKQARESKRKHTCTSDEAKLCCVNGAATHYTCLQENLATYHVNEYHIDRHSIHFPVIYKKRRTEKGHNSTTFSTSSTVTPVENSVKQPMTYPLKDICANHFTLETNCIIPAAQFSDDSATAKRATSSAEDKQQTFKFMLASGHTERLTKKRSKGYTRVRDLASLSGFLDRLPASLAKGAASDMIQGSKVLHQPHSCMEALVASTSATMAKKKRTKRNSLVSTGLPPQIWKGISTVDIIVDQFKHLVISTESSQVPNQEQNALIPYNMRYRERNALILYQKDGTVVPLEWSFNPVKKRRPRPKVDLDDETNRVWKLLLGNINSEGIDGTDEEKAKWWEEERRVFRGRADSFIARMHLVQGDRRFSQWKGSVVDSVVGVFLTQNVSDHLSSSAFMSLAARFPHESKINQEQSYGQNTSILVKEPEVYVRDPDGTIRPHEEKSNRMTHDQSSMTLQDKEYNEDDFVVSSNKSSTSSIGCIRATENSKSKVSDSSQIGLKMYNESAVNKSGTVASIGDQRDLDDIHSSQNSIVSSQNTDSSSAKTDDRFGSGSCSNSEAALRAMFDPYGFDVSTVEPLQKAATTALHGVHNQVDRTVSLDKKDQQNQSGGMPCDSQQLNRNGSDGPKASLGPTIPSDNYHICMISVSGAMQIKCFDMSREEIRISDILERSKENSTSEQSGLTADSASQTSVQKIATVSSQEAPKSSNENNYPCNNILVEATKILQSQKTVGPKNTVESYTQENTCKMQQVLDAPVFSGETLGITERLSDIANSEKSKQRVVDSNLNDHGYLLGTTGNGMSVNTSKAKRGRAGKEKQNAVDWDNLRKQAQANGRKRERTANTMDSLDWEAVRSADVNEIANTIRERGMNNMLAERIKDFLNRIVREHGSIDLEWLRDVPPDQAKEYLLSIWGLGLKSVECVRLLTLHHLAFPVDTNVGRIAVRLGWVPLQPLPESLQLHLLELYPVLESIQKYLWPRLCKLDQRTLYELHYQMITFGKVFCTKSKPNCNACPMRGECRHFASAFASARLALPAPEVKSIVSVRENEAADQNSMRAINPLQLPVPQAHQHLELQSEVRNSEPIIEVPSTPEPIVEVPATPEPEQTQVPESDIEDTFYEDPDEIPIIKLNMKEFTQNLQQYMEQNMELQEGEMSKALVALTPQAASIPAPKLKNMSRLRTEHQVYELPDSHPLLEGLDEREPDDPCSYLLAIWSPGETANSIQPPERRCMSQESSELCDEKTCFSCSSIKEAYSQTVRGTLLIPCRTAMRGSFPLNGTYFQVNEVFADHESSLNPINVPTAWLWNLPRRTVYFGTSIPTIFKGLSTEGIQYCFWRGFVCVRGFDQRTRAPRPLMARLHFPASKLTRTKEKTNVN